MLMLVRFSAPEALCAAARAARARNAGIVDAYTPFPVEGIDEYLPEIDRGVRTTMLLSGFAVAAGAYFMEWYSAVISYPFNSGRRPEHSWPVFFLFPFEIAILAAGIAGLIAFFCKTGLPRYHDAVFANEIHESASRDGFLLALDVADDSAEQDALLALMIENGANAVREVRP